MSSSDVEAGEARAVHVSISDDAIAIALADGRTLTVPLVWYPRLWYGTPAERGRFEIFGGGTYIHWPELDEDLTVQGLLEGRRSAESPSSLKRWMEVRRATSG